MKLLSIAICRVTGGGGGGGNSNQNHNNNNNNNNNNKSHSKSKTEGTCFILCQETDTGGMMFGKTSMKEMTRFIVREISLRVAELQMKSLEYKGNICHAFKEGNGLTVCCITDSEYPPRAAHGLIRHVLKEFQQCITEGQWRNAKDFEVSFPQLSRILSTYKEPPKDKILEIQQEIENSKQIVVQSIEKVLENMEQLDALVEKSNDLSNTSRMFYKKSKKMNRCCVIL